MIKKRTVFVIGAGAGKEAEFPTGPELTEQIAKSLDIGVTEFGQYRVGDREMFQCLHALVRSLNLQDASAVMAAAYSIRDGMRQVRSIDTYLDTHQDDPMRIAVGKVAIAKCILEAERKSHVRSRNREDHIPWENLRGTWIHALWDVLTQGVGKGTVSKIFDNITFVVFNYDRTVEMVIYYGLINHYGLPPEAAAKIANSVKIYHPYGSLGALHWHGGSTTVAFGDDCRPDQIVTMAKNINTFSEQMLDKAAVAEMRARVNEAEQIVFLGFAFHRQNMELLRSSTRAVTLTIYGTAYKVSEQDRKIYTRQLQAEHKSLMMEAIAILEPKTCTEFFHEWGLSLTL